MARLKFPQWLVLLLPAIIILLAVVLVPLLLSFYSSFTAYQLTRPESLWKWVGLFNYKKAASDPNFWWAFGRTVALLTIALNLEMLLGLLETEVAQQRFSIVLRERNVLGRKPHCLAQGG